eukprot:CAMPEP_0172426554 /NCGR_PEP_ID=MMETSP1064-20121228/38019_1 /TAXON_ID=202472 /ORGANISM="Aulacoseira subarctica , Strain CCAP 1002/5" /LENGTH=176 /DNA_ID=CAMNT_0013170225 /DNA_START=57 /DNA_END=587 /DNA_ORIENTATION=+
MNGKSNTIGVPSMIAQAPWLTKCCNETPVTVSINSNESFPQDGMPTWPRLREDNHDADQICRTSRPVACPPAKEDTECSMEISPFYDAATWRMYHRIMSARTARRFLSDDRPGIMDSSEFTPYKKGSIIPHTQAELSVVVKLKNVESYLQEEMQDYPFTPDLNDEDFLFFEMDEET